MPVFLAVAAGGALGSLSRYAVDRLIERRVASVFPWSTFTINVTGCFLAGVVVAALVDRHDAPAWIRTGAVVGFLGAYTTFSTFAQESRDLLVGGHLSLALADTVGSVVVGVLAVVAGSGVGRML